MKLAVIYVNPIEYHGPHLPLKTDYEISRGLTASLLAKIQTRAPEAHIAHTIEIHEGCDPAAGPGSIYTSLNDLKQKIRAASEEILKTTKPHLVLFMTFHGAPKHAAAIESGVKYFEAQGIPVLNPFNFVLRRFRDYEPSMAAPIAKFIPDEAFAKHYVHHVPDDFHGGLFESSVLMRLNPEVVKALHKDLPDCEDRKLALPWKAAIGFLKTIGLRDLSNELRIGADAFGWMTSPKYAGYTGAPRFASTEIGEHFVNVILGDYEKGFWEVSKNRAKSPKPILQWTIYLRG
jgi:creatinine amidohydrolase